MSGIETRPALRRSGGVRVPHDELRRLGGECDNCHIGSPTRKATAIVAGQALCNDCRIQLRLDRIAAKIHHVA